MKDLWLLLDSIHTAFCRPEYAPRDGYSACNMFTSEVAIAHGFKDFDGLLANEIVNLIPTLPSWSEMPLERAQDAANLGTLIVAGLLGDPHGHVAVVCPGRVKNSGRWGIVPTVASVGKTNIIAGLNWVFPTMPKLWAHRPSL